MDTVLLTIVKRFVSRWFDTAYRHSPYYCGDKLSIHDSRRANIKLPKLPNHVSGIPWSVKDWVHYKASEDRTWLLYYSLPVMGCIDHFMLLVSAIFTLLKTHISESEIQEASQLLEDFYLRAKNLYDVSIETLTCISFLTLQIVLLTMVLYGPVPASFLKTETAMCAIFSTDHKILSSKSIRLFQSSNICLAYATSFLYLKWKHSAFCILH